MTVLSLVMLGLVAVGGTVVVMGAAAYALTGFKIEDPESVQGGLTFGVVNSLGAYFCLTGIGLLYARTGELGMPQLAVALSGRGGDLLVLMAFVLIGTGWLVKAAAVPFHFWLADAHAVAPAPVCVLFSGVMAPLGCYGLARLYWVVFRGVLPDTAVHHTFLVFAIVTAALGALMCFTQRHIKRLLAYSTISHIGLFLIGLGALNPLGLAGAGVAVAGHAAVKGALFLLTGLLLSRYRSVDELDLYGQARDHKVAGFAFAIGALALAGLPPFGTALGKALMDEAGDSPALTGLTVVVSAVTGAAALRVALRVYFGVGPAPSDESTSDMTTGRDEQPDTRPPRSTPVTMIVAIALLFVGGLVIGFVPGIGPAAAAFVDQHGYIADALGQPAPSGPAVPEAKWTGTGVLLGLLTTVLAVVIAWAGLRIRRVPRWSRHAGRPASVALRPHRRLCRLAGVRNRGVRRNPRPQRGRYVITSDERPGAFGVHDYDAGRCVLPAEVNRKPSAERLILTPFLCVMSPRRWALPSPVCTAGSPAIRSTVVSPRRPRNRPSRQRSPRPGRGSRSWRPVPGCLPIGLLRSP